MKNVLKRIVFTGLLLVLSHPLWAANNDKPQRRPYRVFKSTRTNFRGFFLEGQVGTGRIIIQSGKKLISGIAPGAMIFGRATDTSGLAGRIALGYSFNQNWALEVGGEKWDDARFELSASNLPPGTTLSGSTAVRAGAADILLRFTAPWYQGFSMVYKFGFALNLYRVDKTSSALYSLSPMFHKIHTQDKNGVYPKLEVGLSYDLNDNASVMVSYSRTFAWGSKPFRNFRPDLDLVAFSVDYKLY